MVIQTTFTNFSAKQEEKGRLCCCFAFESFSLIWDSKAKRKLGGKKKKNDDKC